MNATLLVLAAGMGSRYGGLKQLEPMGPNGETLLDYSIQHAVAAGFNKVVFVIRKDFAEAFQQTVGNKHIQNIEVEYAYQALEDLPNEFTVPEGRTKPWGTAHAVRAAREQVKDPFVAINADDYYGQDAYHRIIAFLKNISNSSMLETAMVGYPVSNTLSPHGSVNRGICKIQDGRLQTVEEHTEIHRTNVGTLLGKNLEGELVELPADSLASMNFWAFTPEFFDALETEFVSFLKTSGQTEKAECYIPTVVDSLIRSKKATCRVFPTNGEWFGVTYPDDKPLVQQKLKRLQ